MSDTGGLDLKAFMELIDNIYDEVFIWDGQYRVVYVNKACYRHYGVAPEALIGKHLDELMGREQLWSPSSLPYIYREKKSVIQNQRTFLGIDVVTITVPILGEDNEVKYVIQTVRDNEDSLYKKLAPILPTDEKDSISDEKLIYKSRSMKKLVNYARKVASIKAPLLILGETGTGKSMLAKYVHEHSDRRDKPFVSVNMASINPTLIESEFFGYRGGAFTGANREGRRGFFEAANGGTLFLDEIGELPYSLQAKFLYVLQEEEFIPVGSVQPKKLDVRVICATNQNLEKMVEALKFREDLYHRLNVLEMTIPPLRERPEDIMLLLAHFLNVFNIKYGKDATFSQKTMETMIKYPWKGNTRELSNVVERAVLTSESSVIKATDLPHNFFSMDNTKFDHKLSIGDQSLTDAVECYEKQLVQEAYTKYRTSRKVAEALKISQTKASRLIRKYI